MARFPLEDLNRIRGAVGGAAWASLYQQRPAAAEGAIFNHLLLDVVVPPEAEIARRFNGDFVPGLLLANLTTMHTPNKPANWIPQGSLHEKKLLLV